MDRRRPAAGRELHTLIMIRLRGPRKLAGQATAALALSL